MKSVFSKPIVITALMLGLQMPLYTSAQVSHIDSDKLTEVSRIDFIDGNINFLVVELLKDGLLQENVDIYLLYNANKITLNGKNVSEPYNSRYIQMMKRGGFVADSVNNNLIRCGGKTISKLEEEATRLHNPWNRAFSHNYDRLAKLIVEDGIASSVNDMMIDIAADYVAVNGRILKTPIEKAYEYHFRKLSGFKPKGGEVASILIKHSPQK